MTSSADEARARLWFWLGEADDADAEQRAWKRQRFDGMLLACERTGILPAPEVARWRAMVAQGGAATSPVGNAAAAADHLEVLLADVRPLSRDPEPSQLRAGRRFHGALEALHAAGVVDDEARAAWHARELAASAP